VIATRDGGILEPFFFFLFFFLFLFLLCRYVVPGSCLSKYPSNDTADPFASTRWQDRREIDGWGARKNQNKVKAKKRRDHQFLGYIFDDPAILFPKQIVSSTIFPTPALLPSKHVIDPQIAPSLCQINLWKILKTEDDAPDQDAGIFRRKITNR
jgi:hypothetical protein